MVKKHMFSILMICLFLGGSLFPFLLSGLCTPSYAEDLFTDTIEEQPEEELFFPEEEGPEIEWFSDGAQPEEAGTMVLHEETVLEPVSLSVNKQALPTTDPDRFRLKLEAGLEGEVRRGVSVVLLLDCSASMEENGLFEVLKEAAIEFIHQLAEASPDSEIAVIWYSGGEPGQDTRIRPTAWTRLVPENLPFLEDFVMEEEALGDTPMGAVLETARDVLLQAALPNRFCILFTDGLPGYMSSVYGNSVQSAFNCGVANQALDAAREVKDPSLGNAVLYTIGYGLDASFYFLEGDPYAADPQVHGNHRRIRGSVFLKDFIASAGKQYDIHAQEALKEIYAVLARQVIRCIGPQILEIRDVISPEFVLTDACREKLAAKGAVVTENEDKSTTVVWPSPEVGFWNAEEASMGPWKTELEICARKPCPEGEFPTNTIESAVYTAEGPVCFPVPTVKLYPPEAGALPACGGYALRQTAAGAVLVGRSLKRRRSGSKRDAGRKAHLPNLFQTRG